MLIDIERPPPHRDHSIVSSDLCLNDFSFWRIMRLRFGAGFIYSSYMPHR